MPKPYFKYFIDNCKSNRGFTLIELMIVLVIAGILATGVIFMFIDPTAKVKAAAFDMRGDFNLARAEAVRRNNNVLVDFIFTAEADCSKTDTASFANCYSGAGNIQGYIICFDENDDNDCSDEAATAAELEDKIIKTVLFRDAVQYYDGTNLPPAPSGPQVAPVTAVSLADANYNDGITFGGGNYIYMNSNGTSSDTGSVIVYLPLDGDPATRTVKGKPYAVVVDSTSTGRVILERWLYGAWGTRTKK